MTPTTLTKDGSKTVVIDPDELMIGNLLEYKGKIVHVTTLSLDIDDEYQETIGFCELGKTTDEICDWNRALADGLKPVRLSKGLLEKITFKWNLQIVSKPPGFSVQANQYIGDEENEINFIEYLHELQILYFCISREKLIIDPSIFDKQP